MKIGTLDVDIVSHLKSCACSTHKDQEFTLNGETYLVGDRDELVEIVRAEKAPPADRIYWRDSVTLKQPPDDDDDDGEEGLHDDDEEKDVRKRLVPMVLTREIMDRDDDVISVRGLDITRFRRDNPILLFAHNARDLPIGRMFKVKKVMSKDEENLVEGDAGFFSRDLSPLGDTVFRLMTMKPRGLNMGSIGFKAIEAKINQDLMEEKNRFGLLIDESELLEFSIVPVGSNPGSLTFARSTGIDLDPLKDYIEKNLDEHQGERFSKWMTVKDLEECYTVCNRGARTFQVPEDFVGDKAIPSNPPNFKKADAGTPWSKLRLQDFTKESFESLTATERRRISTRFAITEKSPPSTFGDLRLGHHRANDGAVVVRGVNSALGVLNGARGGINTSRENKVGANRHLNGHRRQFDLDPIVLRAFDDAMEKQLVGELADFHGVEYAVAQKWFWEDVDTLLNETKSEEDLVVERLLELEGEGGDMRLRRNDDGRIVGLDFEGGDGKTGAPASPGASQGGNALTSGDGSPAKPAGAGATATADTDEFVTKVAAAVVKAMKESPAPAQGDPQVGDPPAGTTPPADASGEGEDDLVIELVDDEGGSGDTAHQEEPPEKQVAEVLATMVGKAVEAKFDKETGRLPN